MTDSDSVNLGSNPSPPATTNTDVSATTEAFRSVERSEKPERKAHIGRTETGTFIYYGKNPVGFVYFITDGEAIKIGFSVFVEARLSDLQACHPRELKVIASFRGTRLDESALHRKFAHLRIRREWFRDAPELREFIAEIQRPKPRPDDPLRRIKLVRSAFGQEPVIPGNVAARGVILLASMARARP